jgi:hypothetical protein
MSIPPSPGNYQQRSIRAIAAGNLRLRALDDLLMYPPLRFGVDANQPHVFTLVLRQTSFKLRDSILQSICRDGLATVP